MKIEMHLLVVSLFVAFVQQFLCHFSLSLCLCRVFLIIINFLEEFVLSNLFSFNKFAWCKFMIVFIPVTDLVIVMQINYYYYYYYYYY